MLAAVTEGSSPCRLGCAAPGAPYKLLCLKGHWKCDTSQRTHMVAWHQKQPVSEGHTAHPAPTNPQCQLLWGTAGPAEILPPSVTKGPKPHTLNTSYSYKCQLILGALSFRPRETTWTALNFKAFVISQTRCLIW